MEVLSQKIPNCSTSSACTYPPCLPSRQSESAPLSYVVLTRAPHHLHSWLASNRGKGMSFDLYMWRQNAPLTVHPSAFFEQLSDDKGSEYAEPMERGGVFAAFRRRFPELQDTGTGIDWEGDGSYFQVCFSYDQKKRLTSVQLSCGFSLCSTPSFERIFDVAHDLGCRVYDPQSSNVLTPASRAGGLRSLGAFFTRRKWLEEKA